MSSNPNGRSMLLSSPARQPVFTSAISHLKEKNVADNRIGVYNLCRAKV